MVEDFFRSVIIFTTMVKDLMPLIRSNSRWISENSIHHRNQNLNHGECHTSINMKTLRNEDPFFTRLEDIINHIDEIATNNKKIENLQQAIWIGVNQLKVEEDRIQLDKITSKNRSLGIKIRNFLKHEQNEINGKDRQLLGLEVDESNVEEIHAIGLKRTQVAAQSRRFYHEWERFDVNKTRWRDIRHEYMRKQCKIISAEVTDEEINTFLDEGNQSLNFSILVSNEKATQFMKERLTELEKRRDDFWNLEKAIEEIRDLFVEMADLVHHQGEMINNIERNVDISVGYVEKGTKELEEAVIIQRDTRKHQMICISIIIVVIFILVIIVIGVPISSSGDPTESSNIGQEKENTDITIKPDISTVDFTPPPPLGPIEPSIDPNLPVK